ncbi:hypothetical protein [uncultured Flavobacterium sp.]|uniref:hypothetical protein n=1 Tax=uncultured Flavobacterium sp. TaxID=165435 RepID=UPI0030EBBF56|tara:strand:- start:224580 stop:225368 length:789 start_codon:yes stop_codon:yes gene_type:complete
MKKLLILTTGLLLLACTNDDTNSELNLTSGPKIVGFDKSFESIAFFEDLGQIEKTFAVNFIGLGDGKTSTSNITLNYEVDLLNSTATEGVEFDFVNNTNEITIPAGSTFATIPLNVNTGQLNPTEKTELVLKLTSNTENVVVGQQYKTIKIVFVGCETNLQGTYTNSSGTRTAIVTKTAPNAYRSSYLPNFSTYYWFDFVDICGELTIVDWEFQGGNPLSSFSSEDGLVKGFITDTNNLTFEDANVQGISWYVNLTWTLVKQ